ncbi:MAG: FHA domain-containing protein [Crinalium sp.]
MAELTLTWTEQHQHRSQTIVAQQPSKNPGTVRIGRDPARCDIVLTDPTVSGLHIEIFFNFQQQNFYLRNLRSTNPAVVDGKVITTGEVSLRQGSTIYLGQLALTVVAVNFASFGVPATIVIPPQPTHSINQPQLPITKDYGLRCPNSKCSKTSPYIRLELGCPWCGTSLAAAASVLINN